MNVVTPETYDAREPARLLVMDDDESICSLVRRIAESEKFEVETCTEAGAFIERFRTIDPGIIMLDLNMPGTDGIELLRQLAEIGTDAHIYLMSGLETRILNTAQELGDSLGLNVRDSLHKPFNLPRLRTLLREEQPHEIRLTKEELTAAIQDGHIVVYYQPRVERFDGAWRVAGVEALCRWQHPEHGLLMPDRFIPLAEQDDAIVLLTDHVLRETADQVHIWRQQGIELEGSVNVAGASLTDLEFPDRLVGLLEEFDLPVRSLGLEITETTAMAEPRLTMDILTRLRVKGFKIAMDDFGIGYSSMEYLFKLPFSELKIDKSFVMRIGRSEEAETIARALVDLAHAFGMTACAEGIETAEAMQFLARSGCDAGQGYYVSRAVPASRIPDLYRTWATPES
ncbi:EAL domain-containing response regulator [Lentisalinibacter salinarum]|uniref:EAL domain-containing response regulator n=1 Tax=Lentisalinibacter salinarum TaxID=2992239 RepID=UPI00386395A5